MSVMSSVYPLGSMTAQVKWLTIGELQSCGRNSEQSLKELESQAYQTETYSIRIYKENKESMFSDV